MVDLASGGIHCLGRFRYAIFVFHRGLRGRHPMTPDSPDTPKYTAEQFINALRKAGAGMTKEQADAWKAEIDRARHPELYCQHCRSSLNADTPAEPPSACTSDERQPPPESQD